MRWLGGEDGEVERMSGRGGEIDTGELFREVHRGCWRADAPALELSLREVTALMPLLIRTGSVGLIWPRLRHRAAEYGATGAGLEAAYQAQVAHNALVEREIARVVGHLQGHGIDPVLIKGWAVSRLYPEGIVRPAGDIDLVVRDEDYERAKTLLAGTGLSLHQDRGPKPVPDQGAALEPGASVDMHSLSRWAQAPVVEFFERATPVPIAGTEVLVPCVEDHLHALCVHFLVHGATRPLRLCDIALLAENPAVELDPERLFTGPEREVEQVKVSIGLARLLLGSRVQERPDGKELPEWLTCAVERQWSRVARREGRMRDVVRTSPRDGVKEMWDRWANPVLATVRTGAPFNETPRWPIQAVALARQIASLGWLNLSRRASALVRPLWVRES